MGISNVLQSLKKFKEDLYLTEFSDGTEVVFRLPSWKDANRYNKLISLTEEDNLKELIYEHIFRECVTDSYLLEDNDLPAGIISSTVGVILLLSMALDHTYEDVNALFQKYRELSSSSYLNFIKRTICSVFPAYKFSDLDDINYQKLLETFIEAEQVLLDRRIIETEYNLSLPKDKNETLAQKIKSDIKSYTKFERDNTDRINY